MTLCPVCETEIIKNEPVTTTVLLSPAWAPKKQKVHRACYNVSVVSGVSIKAANPLVVGVW